MNSLEIINYLKNFKNFCGVFSRDQINIKLEKNCGIIINTDTSDGPGEHWVAIYFSKSAIYFDSFGLPPLHDEITKYLNSISPDGWHYNRICFQSLYQDTCGMYCIFFLTCMFKYNCFDHFIEVFKHTTHTNDIIAKLVYKSQI